MATRAKSVQFRNPDDILACYVDQGIVPWAIKIDGAPVFRYEGEDIDEGQAELGKYLYKIKENQSAGIYELCLYDELPENGKINEKTPFNIRWGFRFREHTDTYVGGTENKDLYAQVAALRAEIAAMRAAEPENKLGLIGEILEMEQLQPRIIGLSTHLADKIMGQGKVGELKRVSGIPGLETEPQPVKEPLNGCSWCEDEQVYQALTRLSHKVPDLGNILGKLADMAENNAAMFNLYLSMLRKRK